MMILCLKLCRSILEQIEKRRRWMNYLGSMVVIFEVKFVLGVVTRQFKNEFYFW